MNVPPLELSEELQNKLKELGKHYARLRNPLPVKRRRPGGRSFEKIKMNDGGNSHAPKGVITTPEGFRRPVSKQNPDNV